MSAILIRLLPYLAALAVVLGALFGAYHHGASVTNEVWQSQWNARDTRDESAKAANEASERTKEQSRQQAINKVVQNGQIIIDTAVAAVAAANRESGGLRDDFSAAARRLAASEARGNSCTATASKTAAYYARVLPDVFRMADEAAGVMAANADQSRARGVTCEQAYDGLGK